MKSFLKRNFMDLILIIMWITDLIFTIQSDTSFWLIMCLIVAQLRIVVDNEIIAAYKHDR